MELGPGGGARGGEEGVGGSYFRYHTVPPALKGHQPLRPSAARDRGGFLPARRVSAPPPRPPDPGPASSALRTGGREADGTWEGVAGGAERGGRRGQREWERKPAADRGAGRGRGFGAARPLRGEPGRERPRSPRPQLPVRRASRRPHPPDGVGASAPSRHPARREGRPKKAAAPLG